MDLNGHNLLESNVIISFNSQRVYCATLQHSCQWWQTIKNFYDPQQGNGSTWQIHTMDHSIAIKNMFLKNI